MTLTVESRGPLTVLADQSGRVLAVFLSRRAAEGFKEAQARAWTVAYAQGQMGI